MAIVRWDPVDAFLGLQDDLNTMFRRGWLEPRREEAALAERAMWAPSCDIYETEYAIVVEAELPGVNPDNIDVSIEEGILRIKGERKTEKEIREENYYRVERASGSFMRAVRMPSDIDADNVKANFDNGILEVTVPKVEPEKPRSVDIKVEPRKGKKEKK